MLKSPGLFSLRSAALVAVLAGSTAAAAFAAMQPAKDAKEAELVRDFVHYVRIDRTDLAKSYGEALLRRLAPPFGPATAEEAMTLADFVAVVEQGGEVQRFEEAAARGQRIGDLEVVAAKLLKAFETGKLEQARNPDEVTRNIGFLTGEQRARLIARERLAFAGEYAAPQLLAALTNRTNATLSAEARQLLTDMGKQAVMPLAAALAKLDPVSQEQVAAVLGNIPYRASVPFLADTMNRTTSASVKAACEKAIRTIEGGTNEGTGTARLFSELGEAYYGEPSSLTSFPGEAFQLTWNYDPNTGLFATPIDTRVYHEVMAMTLAERALAADATSGDALALWLAANLKRELETPAGYENPAWGKDKRSAMYYAVSAGARPMQRVLARALDDKNTPLARKAIAALTSSTGSATMVDTSARNALIEALRYPNRRVQTEAALALAGASPATTFDGSDRVVPVLGSAIRDAGTKFAAVIATDVENQQSLANVARGLGYTVLPAGSTLEAVEAGLGDAPGVDLVLLDLPAKGTDATITAVRGNARFAATPVLALLPEADFNELGTRFNRDAGVRLVRSGTQPAQQAEAATQLLSAAVGGDVSADEGASYQDRALDALRGLAMASNPVYNVADAAGPLVAALNTAKGGLKMRIAEVLSHVSDKRVQVALMDATLAAEGDDQLVLLGDMRRSARRSGNLLDDRQIRALLERAGKGDDALATAVAGLIGALGLSNENLVPLITGQ
ncbi:MAG: hypothetical protein ACKVS8_06075 [Phycisphaerales bacterium]